MSKLGYSIFGKGPQRRHRGHKGPTSLHRDLCNFGSSCHSARLSNREFNRQLVEEVGYFGGKAADHFGSALHSLGQLCGMIFS